MNNFSVLFVFVAVCCCSFFGPWLSSPGHHKFLTSLAPVRFLAQLKHQDEYKAHCRYVEPIPRWPIRK